MADCSKTEVFFAEWERMCQHFSCGNCPLEEIVEGKPCSFWAKRKPEDIIKAIQKWSEENPVKTRLSMFLEMFPNAEIADDGMPYIYPCKLDANYEFSEDCKEFLGGFRCGMCKKEYWLAEVE